MEEVAPAFIRQAIFMHPEKRPPPRREGLDLRVHVHLMRKFVPFASVATEAGGDDVIPSGAPALIARSHMVEVKLRFRQCLDAVLAGELVPQENIAAGKFYFKPWQAIVHRQNDDFRNSNRNSRAVDHFRIRAVT